MRVFVLSDGHEDHGYPPEEKYVISLGDGSFFGEVALLEVGRFHSSGSERLEGCRCSSAAASARYTKYNSCTMRLSSVYVKSKVFATNNIPYHSGVRSQKPHSSMVPLSLIEPYVLPSAAIPRPRF